MDRGNGGGKGMMLLKPGRIKAKGGKAKSTAIDATGHAEYNEDASICFEFWSSSFMSFSR